MTHRRSICDTCGEEDATTMRGDLAVCGPCAAGEREDSRPPCPRCPFCGYTWDETHEGRDAPLYAALRVCAS